MMTADLTGTSRPQALGTQGWGSEPPASTRLKRTTDSEDTLEPPVSTRETQPHSCVRCRSRARMNRFASRACVGGRHTLMNTRQKMNDLRRQVANWWEHMQEIDNQAQAQGRSTLTADERRRWEELDNNIRGVEPEIQRLERALVLGEPIPLPDIDPTPAGSGTRGRLLMGDPVPSTRSMAEVEGWGDKPAEPHLFARWVRSLATGDTSDPELRALGETTGSVGGGEYTVPVQFIPQVIDLARAKSTVVQAGAVTIPITSDEAGVPVQTGDPTPEWRDEHAAVAEDDPTFSKVEWKPKSLAVLTKMSRELLEDSPVAAQAVQNAIGASIGAELDRVALFGSGIDPEPQGVQTATGITTLGTVPTDGDQIDYDYLARAVSVTREAHEEPTAIIMATAREEDLGVLKDTTGQYLRPPAYLESIPRRSSSKIATNETFGASTDCSTVFVGDFTKLGIGMRTRLGITILRERYADLGQVGVLAWLRADIALLRPAAFTTINGMR